MSNVLVISTSLRARSNSDILAERLAEGAKDAGHRFVAGEVRPSYESGALCERGHGYG